MLKEFEARLADVLGTRLPAPFAGAVDVLPGSTESRVLVSVNSATPMDAELLSKRPELVPGSTDPRRVVRLRCEVHVEVRPMENVTRQNLMSGLDQALYLFDDASLRDGSALLPGDDSDPGFLIRQMRLADTTPPTLITVEAEGLFWPVGVEGQSGAEIVEARMRAAFLPLRLIPANPRLTPNGDRVDLRIEFGAVGEMRVAAEGEVTSGPYGSVIVNVVDSGGRPGAGTLGGGSNGPDGGRVLPVAQGAAVVRYTPPATPTVDQLVIALENNGSRGIELGRFALRVRNA